MPKRSKIGESRIYVPNIKDDIINELSSLESCLEWMKRLEQAQSRLEEELQQIRAVLKFVVRPRFNKLNREEMERIKELKQEI